jgi:DNA-binding CsgD family transcriptional regulator
MPRSRRPISPQLRTLTRYLRSLKRNTDKALLLVDAYLHLGTLPRLAPPPALPHITPMEMEIWRRIAHEAQDKYLVIHQALGLNKRTFDNHRRRLFAKLNVHNRASATRLWVLLGMDGDGVSMEDG